MRLAGFIVSVVWFFKDVIDLFICKPRGGRGEGEGQGESMHHGLTCDQELVIQWTEPGSSPCLHFLKRVNGIGNNQSHIMHQDAVCRMRNVLTVGIWTGSVPMNICNALQV